MKRVALKFMVIFILISSFACKSGGSKAEEDPAIPPPIGSISSEDMKLAEEAGIVKESDIERAIELRKALRITEYRSGVYVYTRSMVFPDATKGGNAAQLAARLKLLGLYDVYLSASKEMVTGSNANGKQWLREFISAAHTHGLTIWATRFAELSHYNSTGSYPNIDAECARLVDYNQSVEVSQRFDAYSADYEPQILKSGYTPWPSGLPNNSSYWWDGTNGYTIDGANNRLLKITIDMLAHLRSKLGEQVLLSEAIGTMYQSRYNEGKIAYGDAAQFLTPCSHIIAMAYYGSGSSIWSNSQAILASANKKGAAATVSICIKPSDNGLSGSLSPRTWSNLISTMNYIYEPLRAPSNVSFRGVDFFEYEGLEELWLTL